MEEQAVVKRGAADLLEQVVIGGDLSKLTAEQRVSYYKAVCESIGLNPLTRPFDYIVLNGKLTLYAKKDAADQLREKRGVSITKLERETAGGVYVVTAYASTRDGRTDSSIGAVSIENLKGDALANAYMKAETKAKRRVTLSIGGLGFLDETEIETIPAAEVQMPKPEPKVAEHWINSDRTRAAFWARAAELGLSNRDVHTALGVEHIEQYAGTLAEAGDAIKRWIAKSEAEQLAATVGGKVTEKLDRELHGIEMESKSSGGGWA